MAALFKAPPNRERAAALVIVLAFVVLLTGLVLAYLSRATSDRAVSQSSVHQSKADQVAASGMDLVIGALRQEITGPSPTPTPPYFPLPNANMLPLRFGNPPGSPDPIPNLVRRSVRADNTIPAPGISSLASAVNSTTDVSPNGRFITLPRWNKHYLIPRPVGANDTDTTPISGASGFTAPDWVILTRNGAVAFAGWDPTLADQTPTNNSYAVGRYAYAVYDEGGLLDVNVVGYPNPTPLPAQYGPKGVSAFADLTVAGIGILSAGVNGIVGWRNYFSASPSGTFPTFTFNTAGVNGYVSSVLSNANGFTSVSIPSPTPNNMSRTDQQFPTRQSLIQLRAGIGSTNFPVTALQYLTTFSRELNAPSWAPTQDALDMGGNNGAGNVYAYKTNADSGTAINRNLLNVHVINSFVRADGTTTTVGDSLINRRFPLTRIAGLGLSGPVTTGNPTTIFNGVPVVASTLVATGVTTVQRDFGLKWDNANTAKHWDYVGATGSTVQTAIKRLDQVAAENREPNFFELLKAVILNGSVGLGSGGTNTFVAAQTKYYSAPLSSDYQIMQIGANIIDQWDSNNVPTFITFKDPVTATVYELAGVENLPYLNKLVFKPYWSSATQFDAWLIPSLWNPSQNAPPASQNVRIAMTSGTLTANTTFPTGTTLSIVGSPTQFMTVDASLFGTVANPSTNNPSAPTVANGIKPPSLPSSITKSPDNLNYGFHPPSLTGITTAPSSLTTAYPNFGPAPGCTFELQVEVSTSPSVWKAYQKWTAQPATTVACQSPSTWIGNTTIQDPEFVTLDPRTVRFGVWGNAAKQSTAISAANVIDYTEGTQRTLDWPAPRFELITGLPPAGTSFSSPGSTDLYQYANNVDGTVHYTDLDGVQRLGDFISGTTTAMLPTDWADRPLILSGAYPSPTPSAYANGGFQSVAELGEVSRDQPWKTLNFTTASPNATSKSADAGLLDIFTLHESANEAGKTSLNARYKSFLTAILSNATKKLTGANVITTFERDNIVNALFTLTQAQPMVNKAELITRLAADPFVTGLGNKEARELVLRAFSDACQTRTWNLMIDVIAQSGRYPPNASTLAGFLVEGEQHYWVHVAIDRFTGQVVDKQIEVVNE